MKRYDERDTMFARMNYEKCSPQFEDYYKRNPDNLDIDNSLRQLPDMGTEGSVMYDKINSPIVDAVFKYLSDIKDLSEGTVNNSAIDVTPEILTKRIKGLAQFFNANLIGITEMKDYHYYSHRGRHVENYGDKIDLSHKYGIVFAVEMDHNMINYAPKLPESIAVVKGYLETANIGMILSYYIRELGFDARNHMDGNYLVVAPLVAVDAGLGELGRNGLLITKKYGARVRLGVVTTNMPLICDGKIEFGLQKFCELCGRCAKTCPGKSISKENKKEIDGVVRWKINAEECYKRWRSLGTDCGICICNCPFSDYLDEELVDKIKTSPDSIKNILNKFNEKYPIRPYNKENPEWLK